MTRHTTRAVALATGTLLLAGTAVSLAPAAGATTPTPVYNGCANPLPTAVVGYPTGYQAGAKGTTFDGSKTGVTVWHDGKGWHLRATHNEPKVTTTGGKVVNALVVFEGRVTASRPFGPVRGVALESARGHRDAYWVLQPGRRALGFRFMNYAGIDGLDFSNACAGRTTFEVWKVTRTTVSNLDGSSTTTVTKSPVTVWTGKASTPATDAKPGDDRTTVVVLRTKKA